MFTLITLIALAAGGALYVYYPSYLRALGARRQAADEVARQGAEAQRQAQMEMEAALHDAVRSDPETTLLPRVAAAVNPVAIQAAAAQAQAVVDQARATCAEANEALHRRRAEAPGWFGRPVLRVLVFGGLLLFPIVYMVGVAFDYLMLTPVTSVPVAALLAVVLPTLLMVGTAMFSVGAGWHSADLPAATQRAMRFSAAVFVIGILVVLWHLAPQRTAEGHRAAIATAEATYNQLQSRRIDSPQDVPQSTVDLAKQTLDATHGASEQDAEMQRYFSVGIALGEIILGEAALLGLAVLPIPLGELKLRGLKRAERHAMEEQRQKETRAADRVQQVAVETVDFLRAHGVPDPRGTMLRILAGLRLIPASWETVTLNLGTSLEGPALESRAPDTEVPPGPGSEVPPGPGSEVHPLLDDSRSDDDYDVAA